MKINEKIHEAIVDQIGKLIADYQEEMLTERQQQIKRYCKQFHDRGLKPKISDIATAFSISVAAVKEDLAAIRWDKPAPSLKMDVPDFLMGLFK